MSLWRSRYRQLADGELLEVAIHAHLEKAEAQVRAFQEHWPGVYRIAQIVDGTGAMFGRSLYRPIL